MNDPHRQSPNSAAAWIPGDLMVEFVGTRDKRWLSRTLTPRQMEEYLAYRFFLRYGQSGLAFRDL
jgi:hypothetical protein